MAKSKTGGREAKADQDLRDDANIHSKKRKRDGNHGDEKHKSRKKKRRVKSLDPAAQGKNGETASAPAIDPTSPLPDGYEKSIIERLIPRLTADAEQAEHSGTESEPSSGGDPAPKLFARALGGGRKSIGDWLETPLQKERRMAREAVAADPLELPRSPSKRQEPKKPQRGKVDPEPSEPQESGQKPKKQKPKKPPKPLVKDGDYFRGQFNDEEVTALYAYRERWCRQNNASEEAFQTKVQGNARDDPLLQAFWVELSEAMPYPRQRTALQKMVRRKLRSNFQRGRWSPAEDDELKRLYAQHGAQWKTIGKLMDRFYEDCRDRWRNYLACEGRTKGKAWSELEVDKLKKAVASCAIKVLLDRAGDDKATFYSRQWLDGELAKGEDIKSVLRWETVSKRIGSCSRLQCLAKWEQLLSQGKAPATVADAVNEVWEKKQQLWKSGLEDDGIEDAGLEGIAEEPKPTEKKRKQLKLPKDGARAFKTTAALSPVEDEKDAPEDSSSSESAGDDDSGRGV